MVFCCESMEYSPNGSICFGNCGCGRGSDAHYFGCAADMQ